MTVILGGGSLSANIQGVAFTGSATYSPLYDCKAMVYVIGGGGSGAACYNVNSAGEVMCASGGGAGGCAVSLLDLKAAHTYTITVGAGGARVSKTYNSHGSGIAGGNTTFVDGSATISTMTGNGGGAGDSSKASPTSTTTTASAATGGSASGGTLANNTGGGSGTATTVWTSGYFNMAAIASSGGGAVGLFGTGYASGNVSGVPRNTYNNEKSCGGGAGVGGSSGTTSGSISTATGGGSANGPSANVTSFEQLGDGAVGLSDGFSPANALSLGGSGGDVNAACGQGADDVGMTPTAGVGAGGGSTQNSPYQPRGATQNGGVFAGGGAMAVTQTDNFIFYAGNGGTGAGGGAGARLTSSNVTSIQSGAGGSGVVLIQILEKS